MGQVFGEMILPDEPAGDFLLLAAGSGITPLMSLTRALLVGDAPVTVTLSYWAQTRAELCFLNELQALGISTDETDMLLNGVRSTDYELVRYGPEGIPAPSAAKEG